MSRFIKDAGQMLECDPMPWVGWLPLAVLPVLAWRWCVGTPRWVVMWMLALAFGLGCKWLTWWTEGRGMNARPARHWAYLFAWPGMNAREFLDTRSVPPRASRVEWFTASIKTIIGACIVWLVVRRIPSELAEGWTGLAGMALMLHFGIFDLLAFAWKRAGACALPLMRAPLMASSVTEFWNRRWNVAFNHLVHRLVFVPTARRVGLVTACLTTFLVSGVIHDLVISVPAGGGYGLPTAYFILQGGAVLFERSPNGRRLGLRGGWRGRVFMLTVTAGPVFWLFHPPFIRNVVLPMLKAIGAI